VHSLIVAQSPSGAWSSGGAILTFVLPMVLFIVVAFGLYILYTKPSVVPGRRSRGADHPVASTAVPGTPIATEVTANPATAVGNPGTAAGSAASGSAPAGVRAKARLHLPFRRVHRGLPAQAGESEKAETEGTK
jgi:hypothetical protein